ncbi:hypothetical protein [Chitinophaga barathri]|uniref:Uncharacterized protein n=1 Tax=Chitinophaga barathri TaxID=1647451 RepID=A0A3N4MFZ7_9BACT|nr:hypothetical protein [Chitinophaga barathri]RPD38569.1 hypothetical protein EG028_25220 [Chitinophaga barathri]
MYPELGPQVILIDDKKEEIEAIEKFLEEKHIGSVFFEADPIEPDYPLTPIDTVQLVFLDLYYGSPFAAQFDPNACTEWIERVIPPGQKYYLVIWTKDKSRSEELLELMRKKGVPMPYQVETRSKTDYKLRGGNEYDIERLLDELGVLSKPEVNSDVQEFHGRIISEEEDCVLIDCLIHKETATYEVRRFDLKLLEGIPHKNGSFVMVRIETKPGSRTIDFFADEIDRSALFVKPDDFEDLEDISFLADD